MFKKNMISVGLDLGTSTIKLAKLKFTKEGVEIVDFFIAP
ncbi:MAG: fimbrial assembly protein, partial [Candidatus Omnitrophica bacterium]|nr:fimbrial assembly protein [Candidatus Omnitrophota bacterium]